MLGRPWISSRQPISAVACLCGVVGLAVISGIASGADSGKLKTSSESTALAPFDPGFASAQCKPGTKAVSGGFEVDAISIPIESRRAGARGWLSGVDSASSDAGSVTSFAYCRDQKLKSDTISVIVPEGEGRTATATCPQGTKALSGGFEGESDSDTALFPYITRMVGKRTWETTGFNFGAPDTLTAQVHCHDAKGLKAKSVTRTTSADVTEVVAKCKKRQRVVSGGFATDDIPSKGGPFVQESRKRGKRKWVVSVYEAGSTEVTAYAYCEKKKQ